MELTGEHRISAPRATVWAALHDPDLLKDCIKGCKSLEMAGDTMKATVEAKVGPVKATFDADVAIENSVAPERYTLVGEGKGGVAGFAKGSADVTLAEDGPDATILTFKADAKIGGKLAQLGSRLVDSTAKRYASDFFACLSERLNADAPAADAAAATATAPEAIPAAPPTPRPSAPPPGGAPAEPRSSRTVVWVIAAVVVAAGIIIMAAS